MKVYIKFFSIIFFKSLLFVFLVMGSLSFIINLLTELDHFKEIKVSANLPLFLSLLNSPSLIFEMMPFIYLLAAQLFFIKLFENKEIEILKYFGLKNSKIIFILSSISLISALLITILFYSFSSNLKNIYLELKSSYTNNDKYLAVITKNGLWIKDKVGKSTLIINSRKIEQNYLIDTFITEFDEDYNVIKNIKSDKIDISDVVWKIQDAKIYKNNNYELIEIFNIKTNFNYKKIQTLYSNLSSLNFLKLVELRENYIKLNYSISEVNLQLLKLITFPFYLLLMTIFSSLIMLKVKQVNSATFKISLGLFFSVIIYYINNFFYVLGETEKITLLLSISIPLSMLILTNLILLRGLNEK